MVLTISTTGIAGLYYVRSRCHARLRTKLLLASLSFGRCSAKALPTHVALAIVPPLTHCHAPCVSCNTKYHTPHTMHMHQLRASSNLRRYRHTSVDLSAQQGTSRALAVCAYLTPVVVNTNKDLVVCRDGGQQLCVFFCGFKLGKRSALAFARGLSTAWQPRHHSTRR